MRIAVISDLHSNATALRVALASAEAHGFDLIMILGDLLTYGCDPREVLDLVGETLSRHPSRLISGNHDQMYFDLAAGNTTYFDRMPDWLRETAQWTYEALDGIDFATSLPWEKQVSLGGVFFAHANPFAYGDWTYLNKEGELDMAMGALRRQGECIGVFGHTHRGKIVQYADGCAIGIVRKLGALPALSCHIKVGDSAIADPGSIGQPRGAGHFSSLLFIETGESETRFNLQRLNYDIGSHVARIQSSSLSESAKAKLVEYFR
jgi:predicted phosphodiesterase